MSQIEAPRPSFEGASTPLNIVNSPRKLDGKTGIAAGLTLAVAGFGATAVNAQENSTSDAELCGFPPASATLMLESPMPSSSAFVNNPDGSIDVFLPSPSPVVSAEPITEPSPSASQEPVSMVQGENETNIPASNTETNITVTQVWNEDTGNWVFCISDENGNNKAVEKVTNVENVNQFLERDLSKDATISDAIKTIKDMYSDPKLGSKLKEFSKYLVTSEKQILKTLNKCNKEKNVKDLGPCTGQLTAFIAYGRELPAGAGEINDAIREGFLTAGEQLYSALRDKGLSKKELDKTLKMDANDFDRLGY